MRFGGWFLVGFLLQGCALLPGEKMDAQLISAFSEQHPDAAPARAPRIRPLEPRVIEHGEREGNQVALTFDACSTWAEAKYDPRVIDILRETGTPATLFLGGLWMLRHDDVTRELADEPLFELANHAHSHPDMTTLDNDKIDRELAFTQLAALHVYGQQPRLFRPPYVRNNEQLTERAARLGLVTVQYDIASGDADRKLKPEAIARDVLSRIRAGSIVVLHMNNPDLPTAEALPMIIEGLREKGLEAVKVSRFAAQNE